MKVRVEEGYVMVVIRYLMWVDAVSEVSGGACGSGSGSSGGGGGGGSEK